MNQLAEGLLSIARGDDAPVRRSAEFVDVPTVVREVTAEMQLLFEDKDLLLSVDVPQMNISVQADPDGIRRILAVLLDNALKYSSHGDSVRVAVRQGKEDVNVEVSDTGCGIPAESLTRVFDRFYRVDSSRDRQTGGYGLGLAIAQQIARAHRGQIVATSVVGEGSTFRLTLPLAHVSEPTRG
jgi:signal transduction histidine kinase